MAGGASSKQKGAAFERLICVHLSLWLTGGKSKDCFWRSAMSGGRATLGARKGDRLSRQAGDIAATSPEGHLLTDRFYVEAKFYKDLNLETFFLRRGGNLTRFWETCLREALAHKRKPLLIAKQNIIPTLVVARHEDILIAAAEAPEFESFARQSLASLPGTGVSVYLFDDLFPLRKRAERIRSK